MCPTPAGPPPDSFFYQANGTGPTAKVTLTLAPVEATGGIVVNPITYNSTVATSLAIKTPGPLAVDKDLRGLSAHSERGQCVAGRRTDGGHGCQRRLHTPLFPGRAPTPSSTRRRTRRERSAPRRP